MVTWPLREQLPTGRIPCAIQIQWYSHDLEVAEDLPVRFLLDLVDESNNEHAVPLTLNELKSHLWIARASSRSPSGISTRSLSSNFEVGLAGEPPWRSHGTSCHCCAVCCAVLLR
jgi:hypothetical protein